MSNEPYCIDWRSQLSALESYLDGQGGIVKIAYKGHQCAPNSFLALITSLFENRGDTRPLKKQRGLSLRIDRNNYSVLYMSGIRRQFQSLMQVSLPSSISIGHGVPAEMFSHNSAGGSQSFEYHSAESDVSLQIRRDEWISAMYESLKDHLRTGRFMFVLMHGATAEQSEFWSELWSAGLSSLVDEGLLLVRMVDELSSPSDEDPYDGTPQLTITLPEMLPEQDVPHAIEDVAALIRASSPALEHETCRHLAVGYVGGLKLSTIDKLRNNIPMLIEQIRKG